MKAIVITLVVFLLITGILINYLHRRIINIVVAVEELAKHYKTTLQEINKAMLNHSTRIERAEKHIKELLKINK